MAHDHHHHHHSSGENLKVAFFLNLAFTVIEIFGGIYTNSIAIISDAIHDLGDSLSLGTAWYLERKSKQEADKHFSFGYRRFSLLGALINSLVLIAGSIYVINQAIGRILEPEPSNASGMILFAVGGILINGFAAWKLSGGKSLNEKVVSWHLMEDVLGWVAVLIVAIVLLFKEVNYLDPALSLFIAAYILWNVVRNLKKTLYIFLQGTPDDIKLHEIEARLLAVPSVQSMHHTHVWSLEGENHVFTTHVKLEHISTFSQLLEAKMSIKKILRDYPFQHYTVETELDEETCGLGAR
ncbi:MAG: cation transporter [Saprospiraceae bacterium]|nr:cation transporter [Saprospiraceae bacterium]